ncbi:MAG: hypothetical protein AAF558_00640 [Verrucomicrobiota bacterium]
MKSFFDINKGSHWKGTSELWTDPLGNEVYKESCALQITTDAVCYTWIYEGKKQNGSITWKGDHVHWVDTWHQTKGVDCEDISTRWGIFTIESTYQVPSSPDWGWRIKLSQRPDESLVLQMTNIAPWGEEGRAVRMVFEKD